MPVSSRKNPLRELSLLKLVVLGAAALVAAIIVLSMLGMFARSFKGYAGIDGSTVSNDVMSMPAGMPEMDHYAPVPGVTRSMYDIMPPVMGGVPAGGDAESFTATDYYASIHATKLSRVCDSIESLRDQPAIVFITEERRERSCSFMFKVENAMVGEVVARIENLDPEEFTRKAETIQREVRDYTSETAVLDQKLAAIEKALEDASVAYDDLISFAVENGNADALSTAVSNKLSLIERLNQERMHVAREKDRLSRAREEALDRLEYTHFLVDVWHEPYVDFRAIAQSWKDAVVTAVATINNVLQGVTIGLIAYLLFIAQFALYGFILLILVKYAWRWGKKLWHAE